MITINATHGDDDGDDDEETLLEKLEKNLTTLFVAVGCLSAVVAAGVVLGVFDSCKKPKAPELLSEPTNGNGVMSDASPATVGGVDGEATINPVAPGEEGL